MSEYQYYEFKAVDKPLSEKDMKALRNISTRARITPTSFVNEYNWGDFKGNPRKLVEKYFDTFLYVANWGTHWFMLKVPRNVINVDLATQYCIGESAIIYEKGEHLIFEFLSETDDFEWEEGENWLSSMISLRADIISGDLSSLYLAWLFCAQMEEIDDNALEPPVPPNLDVISAPLKSFVDFMRIDTDLIAVAAENSERTDPKANNQALKTWIENLPEGEKNDILFRLIGENSPHLGTELRLRFQQSVSDKGISPATEKLRTVENLLTSAETYAEDRRRKIAEQKAKERALREHTRAIAREKYLDSLAGREKKVWIKIENIINTRQPGKYDEAVKLLVDLRDLSKKMNKAKTFDEKLKKICETHIRKSTFLSRLKKVDLGV